MTEKDLQNRLVQNLKKIRKEQKLTQESLAEKAGLSAQIINDIEGGRRWPRLVTLSKITEALKIDIEKLFHNEVDHSEKETEIYKKIATDIKKIIRDFFTRYGVEE